MAFAAGALKCAILPASYTEAHRGQAFELAFPCVEPAEVDRVYAEIVARGATPVHAPADMPWGQRTAMFADPDGNIHELFAGLKQGRSISRHRHIDQRY